jgi:hypothetical protein
MAITFKWSITKVQVAPLHEGKSNVVTNVEWRCDGTDGDLSAACAGVRELVLGDTFTEYAQLSEQQVLDWCFADETITFNDIDGNSRTIIKHLKVEGEEQITGQIERQLAQKAAEPALPWAEVAQPE